MSLQTSVAIRITIRGDGVSKQVTLDLRTTLVQYVNASYVILPVMPASVITASVGGPNLSPESQLPEVMTNLDGPLLKLSFSQILLDHKDHYTVDLVLGYDSVPAPKPEEPNA